MLLACYVKTSEGYYFNLPQKYVNLTVVWLVENIQISVNLLRFS